MNRAGYGQHDSGWIAFYDFFTTACGLACADRLSGIAEITAASGWWWPFEHAIIMTDRPAELHRDAQGRLHNDSGPSIRYRDGWTLYHVHGVGVPAWIITDPAKITVKAIDDESNAEIKRLMIERFGVSRYLTETGAKLVDFDQVRVVIGQDRLMARALLRDKHGNAYLEGTDGSTERSYFMSVDPEATTCRQAHESISALDESLCDAQS